jgi:hypothetical protein
MRGCNSFYVDTVGRQSKCYYLMKTLMEYRSWIGFSATISVCGRELTSAHFMDPVFINIKSVDVKAGDNILIDHKSFKDDLEKFKLIANTIEE